MPKWKDFIVFPHDLAEQMKAKKRSNTDPTFWCDISIRETYFFLASIQLWWKWNNFGSIYDSSGIVEGKAEHPFMNWNYRILSKCKLTLSSFQKWEYFKIFVDFLSIVLAEMASLMLKAYHGCFLSENLWIKLRHCF